jgi:gamma-glutamylcyclotransferase (GGCT)/AIG2-like uncharacterized protein YtfP
MSEFLQNNAVFLGEGFVYGKLYLVRNYPGLKFFNTASNKVFGEVYKLNSTQLFQTLDEYEEAWPLYPKNAEYKRVVADVYLNDKPLKCWVYECNHPLDGLREIISGVF